MGQEAPVRLPERRQAVQVGQDLRAVQGHQAARVVRADLVVRAVGFLRLGRDVQELPVDLVGRVVQAGRVVRQGMVCTAPKRITRKMTKIDVFSPVLLVRTGPTLTCRVVRVFPALLDFQAVRVVRVGQQGRGRLLDNNRYMIRHRHRLQLKLSRHSRRPHHSPLDEPCDCRMQQGCS